MKQGMRYILLAFIVFAGLISCSKKDQMDYYTGGTAPVLTASSTANTVLLIGNAANTGIQLNWTNPNYQFTTGVSSQDVSYVVQFDTTGNNFKTPQEVSLSRDLSLSMTVRELNTMLAKLNLIENISHNLEMRVKSSLNNNSLALYSNVLKIVVTPYLDVAVPVPVNGELWLTGDVTSSGYMNPLTGTYATTQKFTRVSNTLYEITIALPGGGGYKLIQINGDWSTQYHMLANGAWNAGSFEKKDSDPGFPGPPTAGNYKLSFNFKTGTYTGVKL